MPAIPDDDPMSVLSVFPAISDVKAALASAERRAKLLRRLLRLCEAAEGAGDVEDDRDDGASG